MDNKLKILLGVLIVSAIGMLSIIANFPKIYSPCSLTVIIPALLISSLELPEYAIYILCTLPLSVLYMVWSLFFIKPPFLITKATIILSGMFVLLSIAYNISSYKYGIKYQGLAHTYLMYGYNIIFILLLMFILKRNKYSPSFHNSLSFTIAFFSWLAWVAFPWLGELI